MTGSTISSSAFDDVAFRWLWSAYTVAQTGSALGAVAIPLIAIEELHLDAAMVSLLATSSALVLLCAALPAGYLAEFRRKRPMMIGSDLVRAAMFSLLAVLLLAGQLHMAWMFLALGVNAALGILFSSASSAHTKDLLRPEHRADGLGRLQAVTWMSLILGPVLAGVIAGATSPAVLLLINAAAFVIGAVLVRAIPRPEAAPPMRGRGRRRLHEAAGGALFLLRDPLLRRLLLSWIIFAGAVAALTPISQIFILQDLRLTAFQYGLIMGVPSLGGLLGSWVTGRFTRRWGLGATVWWSSLLRIPWYALYPLALPGMPGLVMLLIGVSGVLFFSSLSNAALGALRMEMTPDHLMSRSSAAWSIATMAAGPVLIPIVGFLGQQAGSRAALWCLLAIVIASALVLPARELRGLPRAAEHSA